MTTTEIKTEIEQNSGHKFFGYNKLGIELRKIFTRKARRIGGIVAYGYEVTKADRTAYNTDDSSIDGVSDDLPF